MKNGKI